MACACMTRVFSLGPTPSVSGFGRRSVRTTGPGRVAHLRPRADGGSADGGVFAESEPNDQKVIIEPRMTFGLDVHRRIHMEAMRQMAYQSQWRAYCERYVECHISAPSTLKNHAPSQKLTPISKLLSPMRCRSKRDWKTCVSDEDETTLCSFHYELEKGLERFERAKENDDLGGWPPRTLHPTQGLPAIQASFRAAVQNCCEGRETLFRHYAGPGRRKFQLGRQSGMSAKNTGDGEV